MTLQGLRDEVMSLSLGSPDVDGFLRAIGQGATTLLARASSPRDWTMQAGIVASALALAVPSQGPEEGRPDSEFGSSPQALLMLHRLFRWSVVSDDSRPARLSHPRQWLGVSEDVGRPCAVIALCRGTVSCMPRDLLVEVYHTDSPSAASSCLLLSTLLPLLLEQCRGGVPPSLRHVAFGGIIDCLTTWGAAARKGLVDLGPSSILLPVWLGLLEPLAAAIFSAGEDRGEVGCTAIWALAAGPRSIRMRHL